MEREKQTFEESKKEAEINFVKESQSEDEVFTLNEIQSDLDISIHRSGRI